MDFEVLKEGLIKLERLEGKRVLFRSDYRREAIALHSIEEAPTSLPYDIKSFSKHSRERNVAGIDSSCVLIGETQEGPIFAGRVAIVTSRGSKIRNYHRAGPFIFYMNQSLCESELPTGMPRKTIRAIIADNALAERFIRIRLERAAQIQVAKTNSDSIILVDGAIRASLLESRGLSLDDLERVVEDNFNQLIGVTKATSIRFIAQAALVLQSTKRHEVFLDITEPLSVIGFGIRGKVLVSCFTHGSQIFRVDASRANAESESQVLADLKHNDSMFRGYPETLRLAHHLSVFDSATVSSVRGYLSKKYGLVQIPSDDLRATILGKLV